MQSRIMYIERKAGRITGEARIGQVRFSHSGRTPYYRDGFGRTGERFVEHESSVNPPGELPRFVRLLSSRMKAIIGHEL